MSPKETKPLMTDPMAFIRGAESAPETVRIGIKEEDQSPKEKPKHKEQFPWDGINPDAMQAFSTRINSQVHQKLLFVATHKKNITAIVNEAIREKVDKMLKERGIK